MKVAIFVDQFPVRSQTFVLNQVIGLIDLGVDITIVSLHKGDNTILVGLEKYNLAERICYLLNEPQNENKGRYKRFFYRIVCVVKGLLTLTKTRKIITSFNKEFGRHGKSMLLASITSYLTEPLQFDVTLCHFGYNGILANKLRKLGLLKSKIATIFHGHEISDIDALKRYGSEYINLFNETELQLPISNLWKTKIQSLGCPINNILVHRMGVDLEKFQYNTPKNLSDEPLLRFEQKILKIFTVARFTEKKGLKYAIESLIYLPKTMRIEYILAGYGELEDELKQQVNLLGLDKVVKFVGACSQESVAIYMKNANVYLQPSVTAINGDMEGVPVTIMEAMAIGLPVVSSFHSGIPELIENGVHGLLVPEKDPQAIAEKLTLIYNNKESVVEQLIRNARDRVDFMADNHKLNQNLRDILYQLSC